MCIPEFCYWIDGMIDKHEEWNWKNFFHDIFYTYCVKAENVERFERRNFPSVTLSLFGLVFWKTRSLNLSIVEVALAIVAASSSRCVWQMFCKGFLAWVRRHLYSSWHDQQKVKHHWTIAQYVHIQYTSKQNIFYRIAIQPQYLV